MHDRFDLIVIGGGPGGYVAALRAAQLGMRVACVEKTPALGGTCLNVGCIPSKALLDSSELFRQASVELKRHGIRVGSVELDLAAMMGRKDRVVRALTQGIAGLFKRNKVTLISGIARLESDPLRVVVRGPAEETVIESARILVATGSAPIELPSLPFDGQRIVSSTEALSFSEVPGRLLVVGAGAIGLELGSVWSRLGSSVTVVEIADRIVPTMDAGMGKQLRRALERQGLAFKLETSAKRVERTAGGLRIDLDSREGAASLEADVVLVAVGRRPVLDGLGAAELGIDVDDAGRVIVDARYESSVPGVFAVGDVIRGPMLAHRAMDEGVAAVELMAGHAGHVNYEAIPSVVYTWPELASVGRSEEDVAREGLNVKVGEFPFAASGRARCLNDTEGSVKVLADAKTDRIVGLHILGPRASDLIAEAAIAVEFGASAEDVARSVHAHPTLAEAIKEAALATDQRALHV